MMSADMRGISEKISEKIWRDISRHIPRIPNLCNGPRNGRAVSPRLRMQMNAQEAEFRSRPPLFTQRRRP